MRRLAFLGLAGLAAVAVPRPTQADPWPVRTDGPMSLDAGLTTGFPAGLPTGLSTGLGIGLTRPIAGGLFTYGARTSWTSATESSTAWTVTQADLRLRATASIQHVAGRGTLSLRLGVGPTLVREHRVRNQGMRAGLPPSQLESIAWATLPAADLEGVVVVHVYGAWALVTSGGPTIERRDGSFWGGFTAELGVAWQP